jgi:uncharacterized protein (TIGR00251 family)
MPAKAGIQGFISPLSRLMLDPGFRRDDNLMSSYASFFENGIRISVKAKPGASGTRTPRVVEMGEGKQAVEIAVSAVAEDGKANKAILETIAEGLGIKKNDVTLKTGTGGRLKIIEIRGEPEVLADKLARWLKQP